MREVGEGTAGEVGVRGECECDVGGAERERAKERSAGGVVGVGGGGKAGIFEGRGEGSVDVRCVEVGRGVGGTGDVVLAETETGYLCIDAEVAVGMGSSGLAGGCLHGVSREVVLVVITSSLQAGMIVVPIIPCMHHRDAFNLIHLLDRLIVAPEHQLAPFTRWTPLCVTQIVSSRQELPDIPAQSALTARLRIPIIHALHLFRHLHDGMTGLHVELTGGLDGEFTQSRAEVGADSGIAGLRCGLWSVGWWVLPGRVARGRCGGDIVADAGGEDRGVVESRGVVGGGADGSV